jgi:hypothetical protein
MSLASRRVVENGGLNVCSVLWLSHGTLEDQMSTTKLQKSTDSAAVEAGRETLV